jgi:hypothetical protein
MRRGYGRGPKRDAARQVPNETGAHLERRCSTLARRAYPRGLWWERPVRVASPAMKLKLVFKVTLCSTALAMVACGGSVRLVGSRGAPPPQQQASTPPPARPAPAATTPSGVADRGPNDNVAAENNPGHGGTPPGHGGTPPGQARKEQVHERNEARKAAHEEEKEAKKASHDEDKGKGKDKDKGNKGKGKGKNKGDTPEIPE